MSNSTINVINFIGKRRTFQGRQQVSPASVDQSSFLTGHSFFNAISRYKGQQPLKKKSCAQIGARYKKWAQEKNKPTHRSFSNIFLKHLSRPIEPIQKSQKKLKSWNGALFEILDHNSLVQNSRENFTNPARTQVDSESDFSGCMPCFQLRSKNSVRAKNLHDIADSDESALEGQSITTPEPESPSLDLTQTLNADHDLDTEVRYLGQAGGSCPKTKLITKTSKFCKKTLPLMNRRSKILRSIRCFMRTGTGINEKKEKDDTLVSGIGDQYHSVSETLTGQSHLLL